MEDRLLLYAHRIHEVYPDFDVVTIGLNDDGQNNDVVGVNENFIFRFPRYAEGIKGLERETAILRAIQPHVTLAVPNPIYASFDNPVVGQTFMGYRMISGEPLRRETMDTIHDEDTLQALAMQLATFLTQLHNVPLDAVMLGGVTAIHPLEKWEDMYGRIRQKLFPYMRPDARTWTTTHFETFLRDPRNHAIAPALVHGDFGTGNILYDAKTQTITGVIDFGSAGLDDPAVDFAAASTIGPSYLDRFYFTYPEIEAALERVWFYKGTFALQEALFGIENGDEEAFHAGLADVGT